jgi:hypothetical protein
MVPRRGVPLRHELQQPGADRPPLARTVTLAPRAPRAGTLLLWWVAELALKAAETVRDLGLGMFTIGGFTGAAQEQHVYACEGRGARGSGLFRSRIARRNTLLTRHQQTGSSRARRASARACPPSDRGQDVASGGPRGRRPARRARGEHDRLRLRPGRVARRPGDRAERARVCLSASRDPLLSPSRSSGRSSAAWRPRRTPHV